MRSHCPLARPILVTILLICTSLLPAHARGYAPPPANDDCSNAAPITITGGGFDYGIFISAVSDLAMATGQNGEYFDFPAHTKSVWYEFNLPTHRNFTVRLVPAPGSTISGVSLTLYQPMGCLPGKSDLISAQSGDDGGVVQNNSCDYRTYKIQVSAPANSNASVFVEITLACPSGANSKYDCPTNAYVFNSGNPLPQGYSYSDSDTIGCQSLDEATEGDCLPLPDKADYLQSTWYVFTTGNPVDLLSIRFNVYPSGEKVGYRIFQGDVRPAGPAGLAPIACGLAREDYSARYIEFPCLLQPNTTYSIALFFHKNFTNNGNSFSLTMRQRGVTATGWPKPVLPPVLTANQLGALPGGGANGTQTIWSDRFDCNAFIAKNTCPPANPATGTVAVGTKTYDLATWATFTLASDANVKFNFNGINASNAIHTRIFNKTLTGNCPSPDPATADLYYEFAGTSGQAVCMPAGDYAIQVLSSSVYPLPTTSGYWDAWSYGNLGTSFQLGFTVLSLPTVGMFRLDVTGAFDAINALNPLQDNVLYPSTPAVFVCANTVLPDSSKCANVDKAMYREVNLGDANGDGSLDSGLLCMSGLRTDYWAAPPHVYSFFRGDANQLATAAGTHAAGQKIPGLTDYAGFCIDKDDNTSTPAGIDNFCACATPGIYTLVSLGDVDNVGKGDAPGFKFNILKTIHNSRANAETVVLGTTGTFSSGPDVFSCADNIGSLPPCGNRKKVVFREFFLPADAVVSITEIGNTTSVLSLFSGRASDLSANLTLLGGCANGVSLSNVVDDCTPLPGGQWYTVVSYGEGPNYTDKKVWNPIGGLSGYMGDYRDVGKTTRISIALVTPITPKFNRPNKAHLAGITDWLTPPPANPNANSWKLFNLPTENFCAPDTPFIPTGIATCAPGYNRVAFYVFEITKPSFVQIRGVDQSFYVEVFPFDVKAQPGSLLTVPPVYQCLSIEKDYRQLCDLPPGKYTIAIFANDSHKGGTVTPSIYVDAVALSRFDHAWNAYDFDLVPPTSAFVNGKTGDVPPIPGQHPSRDVFYCTTGATAADPADTRCNTQLNPLIYAQPNSVPKPQFLPGNPLGPNAQPWRNLWYTFMLSGSGECTLHTNVLSSGKDQPLVAIYESDVNANIPWATLQASISSPGDTIIAGLKLVKHNVYSWCDASGDIVFPKNGCLRDSVRYYVVVSFDADYYPNFPNQAISISIKYAPQPTYAALYDERTTANVVNGLGETVPPYTSKALTPGKTFIGPNFSLLCYTKNVTDPPGCSGNNIGESAWFKFEVATGGQFYAALEAIGVPNSWLSSTAVLSVWYEATPGGPLTQLPLNDVFIPGEHRWQEGCISPGSYYLLVRHCNSLIDILQPYRPVLKLTDSPGDFCSNAVPLNVPNFSAASATVIPDCHTIGTDFGETTTAGMGCLFGPTGKKTSWLRATVTAGPKMDIKFQLAENLAGASLNDLSFRIFFGSCGALTPIVCSAVGSNIITQNCLAPGDYYVQVAMPEKVGSTAVEGTFILTVTATKSNDPNCSPTDLAIPKADFTYTSDCKTITLINLSTAGTDITYLWQFPDGSSSTAATPTWLLPPGTVTGPVTLTVTNTALNKSSAVTKTIMVNNPFAAYVSIPDKAICNGPGSVTLDATVPGATYLWDNGTTNPTRSTSIAGTFWVRISKDGCEKRDTAIVEAVNAKRTIAPTLCPGESLNVGSTVFDQNNPNGLVTLPNAHPSGCDSVLTVSLSFYPPAVSQYSKTICTGQDVFFGNQNRTQSGTYTDTLTSVHGCDSIVTLTLLVTPRQTLSHVASGCFGTQLLLPPTTAGIGYIWNTGETSPALSVATSGSYTVSVSDVAGCVIGEETFSVTILPAFSSSFSANICEGETYDFGGTPLSLSGAHQKTFTAANGCDSVVTLMLTITPRQFHAHTESGCLGASLDLTPIVAGATYAWEGGNTTDTLNVNVPGTYTVSVSDTAGCVIGAETFSVAFGPLNPPNVYPPDPACSGADVSLTATGSSGDYQWFDAATGGNPLGAGAMLLVSNVQKDTTVFVEAVQAGITGCVSQREAVLVHVNPTFIQNASQTICNGDTLQFGSQMLVQSGNYTAIFSTQNGCDSTVNLALNVLPPVFQSTSAGICFGQTYTLPDSTKTSASGMYTGMFTNAAGCTGIWQVALEIATFQTAIRDTVICAGKSFTLPWGDVVTPNANASFSHNWTHTMSGCDSLRLTINVKVEQPKIQFAFSDFNGFGVACFGSANGTVNAVAFNAPTPYQYLWNTGNTTTSVTNVPAGTYTVTVTSSNGCTVVGSQTLTQPPDIALMVVKTDPTCFGLSNGSITATVSGGTPGFQFNLNSGSFQQSPHFENLTPAVYTLTVRDSNGCTKSAQLTLATPPEITLTAVKTDPVCFGSVDGTIAMTASGGGGNFEYSRGNGLFQASPDFGSLKAGIYILIARDMNGCTKSVVLTLNSPPDISLTAEKIEPTCFGYTDGAITALSPGGVSGMKFSLNDGPFLSDPVFKNLIAGSFHLIAEDSNGCRDSIQATLAEPPKINLSATPGNPTCFGFSDGTINIMTSGGTPGFIFSLNSGTYQQNSAFENLSSGSFNLVAADSKGCLDSVQIILEEPPKILLDLTAESPLCPTEKPVGSVSATAFGGRPPLLFALGSGMFSGVSDFKNLPPGLYEVTAQDAAGCEESAEVEVAQPALLPLSLPSVLTLHWGDSVLLAPQIGFQADSFEWSPAEGLSCTNCLLPWAKPAQTTDYQLNVWSTEGCVVTAQVRLKVMRQIRIYVPNVFHPDGNGVNDEFTVFGGPEVRLVRSLSVYDRWGEAVWQDGNFPADGSKGWDGRSRGKLLLPGVYVWVCEIELNDGTREVLAGDVTLVR